MSEEVKPCAGCGAKTNYIEIDVSPYSDTSQWVLCGGTCALVGPSCKTEADAIAAWNALSDAAALARAVEWLEREWLSLSSSHGIEVERDWNNAEVFVSRVEYIGAVMRRGNATAPSFAAALIALAEQVTE